MEQDGVTGLTPETNTTRLSHHRGRDIVISPLSSA